MAGCRVRGCGVEAGPSVPESDVVEFAFWKHHSVACRPWIVVKGARWEQDGIRKAVINHRHVAL